IAHDQGNPLLARASCNRPLQAADSKLIGRQAKIGLSFPSAGWKPEQVGHRARLLAAVGMVQVGQRGQVEENESKLERTPAAVLRSIFFPERRALPSSPRFGIPGRETLLSHGFIQ